MTGTGAISQLPSTFTDIHRKLRLWLEHIEQSLLNDKLRIVDSHAINVKKRIYQDLLDQTFEHEHHLESLNEMAREHYRTLSAEQSRQLQEELIGYRHRLHDVKMFLSRRLTDCSRVEKTLGDFEVRCQRFCTKRESERRCSHSLVERRRSQGVDSPCSSTSGRRRCVAR